MTLVLKRLLQLDLLFKFNLGYLIFFNLVVWQRVESVQVMSYYYMVYMVVRLVASWLSKGVMVRGGATRLIQMSFGFAVVQFSLYLWVLPYILNDWLWMSVAAAPVAISSSFFQMAFNQIVARHGKEGSFLVFFSYRTYLSTLMGVTIPLVFGWSMNQYGLSSVTMVFLMVSLISTFLSLRLPPMDSGVTSAKRKGTMPLPVSVRLIHLFFLITTGFVVQYVDMFRSFFSYAITDNPMWIGWLSVGFALVATMALVLVRSLSWKEGTWYGLATGLFLVSAITPLYTQSSLVLVTCTLLLSFSFFVLLSVYHAAAFLLTGGLTPNDQFHLLYKREVVATLSKGAFAFIPIIFAVNQLSDPSFTRLTFVIAICMVASFILLVMMKRHYRPS